MIIRAHVVDDQGFITNTILVTELDFMPRLVDASIGGEIGDRIVGGQVVQVPKEPTDAE